MSLKPIFHIMIENILKKTGYNLDRCHCKAYFIVQTFRQHDKSRCSIILLYLLHSLYKLKESVFRKKKTRCKEASGFSYECNNSKLYTVRSLSSDFNILFKFSTFCSSIISPVIRSYFSKK